MKCSRCNSGLGLQHTREDGVRNKSKLSIEVVLRFKSKGITEVEWTFRNGSVECIEYFPSGQVVRTSTTSLESLNEALPGVPRSR